MFLLMAISKQHKEIFDYLVPVFGFGSLACMTLYADMPYVAAYFAVLTIVALVPRRSKQHKEIFKYLLPVFGIGSLVYLYLAVLDMPYFAAFHAVLMFVPLVRWWKAAHRKPSGGARPRADSTIAHEC